MSLAHFLWTELNSAGKLTDMIEKLADVCFLQLHRQDFGYNYILCCSLTGWCNLCCFVVHRMLFIEFKTKVLATSPFVHTDLR